MIYFDTTRKWTFDYNNDVGLDDEGFWEWWTVSDGQISFKADDKESAEALCKFLNDFGQGSNI